MWLPTPHFQTSYNWVVRCTQGKIPSSSPEVKLVEWQSRLMPFWISSPASLIVRSPKLQSDLCPRCWKSWWQALLRCLEQRGSRLFPGTLAWVVWVGCGASRCFNSVSNAAISREACLLSPGHRRATGKEEKALSNALWKGKKSHFRRPPISEGDCHLRQTFEGLKWNVATLHLTWRTEVIGNYFCRCLSKETRAGLSKPSCGEAESWAVIRWISNSGKGRLWYLPWRMETDFSAWNDNLVSCFVLFFKSNSIDTGKRTAFSSFFQWLLKRLLCAGLVVAFISHPHAWLWASLIALDPSLPGKFFEELLQLLCASTQPQVPEGDLQGIWPDQEVTLANE